MTTLFIASRATSLVAASNPARAQLVLRGVDALWLGVAFGVPSGTQGIPGLLVPSGALSPELIHTGPGYAFSGAANGATIALRAWESSV